MGHFYHLQNQAHLKEHEQNMSLPNFYVCWFLKYPTKTITRVIWFYLGIIYGYSVFTRDILIHITKYHERITYFYFNKNSIYPVYPIITFVS